MMMMEAREPVCVRPLSLPQLKWNLVVHLVAQFGGFGGEFASPSSLGYEPTDGVRPHPFVYAVEIVVLSAVDDGCGWKLELGITLPAPQGHLADV
jgi:hypothetical protein